MRNVRWHEERQDRPVDASERLGRQARRELDKSDVYKKKAAHHEVEARQALRKGHHKKAAKETAAAEAALKKAQEATSRAYRLLDKAAQIRKSGTKYGRAKTRIGVYDPARGWSDRDHRRGR